MILLFESNFSAIPNAWLAYQQLPFLTEPGKKFMIVAIGNNYNETVLREFSNNLIKATEYTDALADQVLWLFRFLLVPSVRHFGVPLYEENIEEHLMRCSKKFIEIYIPEKEINASHYSQITLGVRSLDMLCGGLMNSTDFAVLLF